MQACFLLGPAGSGKTHRCLAEIRAELLKSPEGLPLVLLAPKQATFQLERQLLADGSLTGYTRLQILSFERLAGFVLAEFSQSLPQLLDEEGRVMVLRALLAQTQRQLKVFRASARLPGFAQHLNLLLRELQRHQHSPGKLLALADKIHSPPRLGDKLHDLALLMRTYLDWLKEHQLQDANCLLDLATTALRSPSAIDDRPSAIHFGGLWLDGFAEMTPQELDFLATLAPFCQRATMSFCLEGKPSGNESWLSPWTIVGQTFSRCYKRLVVLAQSKVALEILERTRGHGRFADDPALAHLEEHWANPKPFEASSADSADGNRREACPTLGKTLRIAICPNPEAEAVLAAREILQHARARGRFRDCAVLLRTLEGYHDILRRVFRRYGIPFFLDRREPVAHHPLAELTRYAVRLAAFDWSHDDWFGALKTGLISSDEIAVDRLENEALARGWKGTIWLQPLKTQGDAELERSINRWLESVLPPFRQWRNELHDCGRRPTGRQLAAALQGLWRALDVEEKLESWSSRADSSLGPSRSVHETVFDQMTAWLDNVELAFANEPLALAEWLPILESGLANLTVGVIPPALDQTLVGTIDRSRNPDLQLAILLGWNEGVFPAKPAPSSLLSDTEHEVLTAHDVRLGPDQRQQLGHERYYAYIACTRARKRLVITCAARDSADAPLNPSFFIERLQRLFPGLKPETVPAGIDWYKAEHSSEMIAPLLASFAPGEPGARRNVIPDPALKTVESLPVFAGPLQRLRLRIATRAASNLPSQLAEQLYGKELRTSVSALEDFAACPFKFFAARGLRAEGRTEFEADQRARGDFQHRILEQFHREVQGTGKRWRDLSVGEARELIGRIGEQLLPAYREGLFLADDSRQFTARVLIAGAQRLIETLIAWMPQYRFDPSFAEVTFGLEQEELPPWRIELAAGHALVLRGRIDRIDLCRPDGSDETLAVVVDYKSRPRSLDAVKLQWGLELQLLSYLGVLRHLKGAGSTLNIPSLLPAGAFYVSLIPKRSSAKTRAEARANSSQTIRSAFQHSGRFNADWLAQFDSRGEPKGDQFKYTINKDGTFARRGSDALKAAAFQRLLTDVEDHLRRIGEAIYDGDVSVAPFRKGSETACRFCEFRAICRFDPWVQPYRVLRPVQEQTGTPERAVRVKRS